MFTREKTKTYRSLPSRPRITLAEAEELLDELLFERGLSIPAAAEHVGAELAIDESEALKVCAEHRAQVEQEMPAWRRESSAELSTDDLPW